MEDELIKIMKHILVLPFSEAELLTLLEAARIAMADADMFADICDNMDLEDCFLSEVRDKLNGVLHSEKKFNEKPTAIVEIIEQLPSVTLCPDMVDALHVAGRLAYQNLSQTEDDYFKEADCEAYEEALCAHDSIKEGDYEIYLLTPEIP